MTLKKFFNLLIVVISVCMVLPIPLAIFVDMTYHWLLLVTLPAGLVLLTIAIILRVVLPFDKYEAKRQIKKDQK